MTPYAFYERSTIKSHCFELATICSQMELATICTQMELETICIQMELATICTQMELETICTQMKLATICTQMEGFWKLRNAVLLNLVNVADALLLNPIRDGPFRVCSRMPHAKKDLLSKICHTYPTMMKHGKICLPKLATFVISRNTDINWILIHNFQFF